jgi:hypothetical protein
MVKWWVIKPESWLSKIDAVVFVDGNKLENNKEAVDAYSQNIDIR